MVGKVEIEGSVDLFPPFRLLLCAVVVAPTKEERVFHSGWAEELSDVMIHAGGGQTLCLMTITTRGHHAHSRGKP
jgi:hypothetical protein